MSNNNETKNLQNIQRIDSDAIEIILQCTQAAFYEFDVTDNTWSTKDQVGPLFVYKRSTYPHYAIMIANRQSLQDFVQPIEETYSLKYDPPYILIHRKDGSIGGIWIYGEDECKRIFAEIQKLRDLVKGENGLSSGMKMESAKSSEKLNEISNLNKTTEVVKNVVKTPEKLDSNFISKKSKEVKEEVISSPSTTQRVVRPLRTYDHSNFYMKRAMNSGAKPSGTVGSSKPQPPPPPKIMSRINSISNIVTKETSNSETLDIAAAAASVFPEMTLENGRGGDISALKADNVILKKDNGILKTILLDLIKRIDPFACRLLNYLPQAGLFEYDASQKKWNRTNTEGPLLVYSRIDEPPYSFCLLDRKHFGKEDFVQPLVSGLKLTKKAKYIFISGRHDNSVYGLWLDQDDCEHIYLKLSKLLDEVVKKNEASLPTIEMS